MRPYSFLTVLLWSSVLHGIHMMPSQKGTNKYSHSERITRLSENDGKTLHRTKRGWMWNQFFLLEEYTGPDTQYVGKVSSTCKGFFTGDASDNPGISPPSLCFLWCSIPSFSYQAKKTPVMSFQSFLISPSFSGNGVT